MTDKPETTLQDVLLSILMALVAAWGIYFSTTQAQSAAFGFFCGANLVFALADFRKYIEGKIHAI